FPDHLAPHPAERRPGDDRLGVADRPGADPGRSVAQLPGPGRAAADALVGQHALRRAHLLGALDDPGDPARSGDLHHRLRHQPDGQRPPRRPRPAGYRLGKTEQGTIGFGTECPRRSQSNQRRSRPGCPAGFARFLSFLLAYAESSEVQWGQRTAARGMVEAQNGQGFVSTGASSSRRSWLYPLITMKRIKAISRKFTSTVRKLP